VPAAAARRRRSAARQGRGLLLTIRIVREHWREALAIGRKIVGGTWCLPRRERVVLGSVADGHHKLVEGLKKQFTPVAGP
jgi:hypothetical protein